MSGMYGATDRDESHNELLIADALGGRVSTASIQRNTNLDRER